MTTPSAPRRSERLRRMPGWTTCGGLALLLLASSHPSADAFAMPKLRSRGCPSTVSRVFVTEERTQLEFGQERRDERDDENTNGGNKKNGQQVNNNINNNGQALNNGKRPPAGSPLSMICEDAKEEEDSFEIHVGRALDTLRSDYPNMLVEQPDLAIYDKELEVIDPSGVKLHGIKNYKNAFRLMHAIVQVFYCPERSGLQYRMCYDTARQNIRVSWNAHVIPKALFGGVRTTLHVDGISVYEISQKSGMITQHRIERLVINDTPVQPQQGIFALLRNEHDESVPVFNSANTQVLEFREGPSLLFTSTSNSNNNEGGETTATTTTTALDAVSAGGDNENNSNKDDYPGMDWEAYERKNASRKKFGLDPLTPEEYMETEAQIKQMAMQQSASAAAEVAKQNNGRQQGFLERLFGDIVPEQCESNFDCQRPEICCDFGFKKICCASGAFVGNSLQRELQPAMVPVPADIYPPGQGPELGGGRYNGY
ncbi:Uncharacterized conserved protein (DUF2358) [Seminavis robusta]|uniref:Uncharacterized conserved protein (DUF2358) n=1 Tax=Seminavis robusta TaxID=568900 RepID=A0A9N8EIU2_9STRA|nr:Uncharacterized conserved protein (DUF2358) [Seminavis robusta]|eukprot:Sro1303_g261000.1 Uncharacterized conserved protein (DUF2358) (484) ;mRNA; r:15669-17242